jgi:PilZ domain
MPSRSALRRKIVLPVTLIRCDGEERQLVHTLDLTATSARIGGLTAVLDPGEIVELQHGEAKAKFQVVWMGTPDGAMAGQAGFRGLDSQQSIWDESIRPDQVDLALGAVGLREPSPPVVSSAGFPGERRWHPRYTCNGRVFIKTAGAAFTINAEAKDVSQGGVYVELSAPLPVGSHVNMALYVEDINFQATGLVRTSYPLLGMGIGFQNLSPQDAEKLLVAVERAKRKFAGSQQHAAMPNEIENNSTAVSPETPSSILEFCRKLLENFDRWNRICSPSEMEEMRKAVRTLNQKLSPGASNGFSIPREELLLDMESSEGIQIAQ